MILDKVWLFAVTVTTYVPPYFYMDDTGKLVGWEIDLVRSVCNIANKKCEFVKLDVNDACSKTGSYGEWLPGNGLMAGWFDSCLFWMMTMERTNSIKYTDPIIEGISNHFYVKTGGTVSCPDPNDLDLTGCRLALMSGAYTNDICLKVNGVTGATIDHFASIDSAVASVVNGQTDALFAWILDEEGLTRCPELPFTCDLGGSSMMLRKDNQLPEWWNPAFKTLVDCGCYDAMCQSALEKHGADAHCLDNAQSQDACALTGGSSGCPVV